MLADLQTPEEIELFLSSFMSSTERLVFAKRLAIVWMLEQGKSYEEISHKLRVSSATISSMAEERQSDGIQLAFKKLRLDEWARDFWKKIFFWKRT